MVTIAKISDKSKLQILVNMQFLHNHVNILTLIGRVKCFVSMQQTVSSSEVEMPSENALAPSMLSVCQSAINLQLKGTLH